MGPSSQSFSVPSSARKVRRTGAEPPNKRRLATHRSTARRKYGSSSNVSFVSLFLPGELEHKVLMFS
uniref:Uncharacterized protein n=1 Tax=Ixodes pacificus TaxID=29930 RepID=Q6B8E7_IXOPA|nr:hypothetical protein [Ixodes pacificus]